MLVLVLLPDVHEDLHVQMLLDEEVVEREVAHDDGLVVVDLQIELLVQQPVHDYRLYVNGPELVEVLLLVLPEVLEETPPFKFSSIWGGDGGTPAPDY